MIRARPLLVALAAALALGSPAIVSAQEEAAPEAASPSAEAPAGEAAPRAAPKRRPAPKPKPAPKPAPKAAQPAAPADAAPAARGGAATRAAGPPAPTDPPPAPATPFALPPVACDPGQAVRYDAPAGADLWVTRAGTITIDNPLRPLTPDTTRVLQVVLGGKIASVYGPDLTALRRGAAPAVLEGVLGGAIRWDAAVGTLPDTLNLVSDAGAPVAAMRFRACGEAPAARALPAPKAQRIAPPPEASAGGDAAGAPAARRAAPKAAAPKPGTTKPGTTKPGTTKPAETGTVPRGLRLPQGAIP